MLIKVYFRQKINGEKDIIMTKTGNNNWMGTICENGLEKGKKHKCKIKILNTYNYYNKGASLRLHLKLAS